MFEVIHKLAHNQISLQNLIDKKTKISIHNLNLNVNLTAMFHSEALTHIIKEDMFVDKSYQCF